MDENNKKFKKKSNPESEDFNSEDEQPRERDKYKNNESSTLLGADLAHNHPVYGNEKPVTFSSSRRKQNNYKIIQNLGNNAEGIEFIHIKTQSAGTTKEQSNTSHKSFKNKSYLSTSNKVSEK